MYGCKKAVYETNHCRHHWLLREEGVTRSKIEEAKADVIRLALEWDSNWSEQVSEDLHAACLRLTRVRNVLKHVKAEVEKARMETV